MTEDAPERTVAVSKVLHKAVRILRAFNPQEPELALGEITRRVGGVKSTTYRLLASLQREGLVYHDARSGRYSLGEGLMPLAATVFARYNLRSLSEPYLRDLQMRSGESVGLHVRVGPSRVCIEEFESPQALRMTSGIGSVYPLYAGAAGKVLLAFMSEAEQEQVLREHPPLSVATGTITDSSRLSEDLLRARIRGYAISIEETVAGAAAIAVPIRRGAGGVVAAINVAGPATRWTTDRMESCLAMLLDAGQAISLGLGYWSSQAPSSHGSLG